MSQTVRGEADDPAVVERCRAGDRDTLQRVFSAEAAMLQRTIARIVGHHRDVEDLLQTTFAEAITAFPRFRGDASIRTWLVRIAVNVVRQSFRKKQSRARVQLALVPQSQESTSAPPLSSVVDARVQLEAVYEHLMKIGIKKRVAFALHVLDGRPMDEVAALVGASSTTTRSRVFWARRELRAAARKDPRLAGWAESGRP